MALSAASMDVGLTKDIYCPEPWWSRNPASNMITINSPAELLHALQSAGNRLIVIDFYAKWCRSCRALYPKLNQICRDNPDMLVLKVDWDDNPELCQVMGVKALPFFHFYQNPFGCVDSFTISVSRIRKLKDTIAVYNIPLERHASQLAGIDAPRFELETEMNTVAAQLQKLGQIFAMT